jgi:hypothetical protein
MTIEDIIDRLTQSTGPATGNKRKILGTIQFHYLMYLRVPWFIDEKFSLIFMTFFRRFMRPRELVELLTERYY